MPMAVGGAADNDAICPESSEREDVQLVGDDYSGTHDDMEVDIGSDNEIDVTIGSDDDIGVTVSSDDAIDVTVGSDDSIDVTVGSDCDCQ